MNTTWRVYRGFVFKIWQTQAAGWCVSIQPRGRRSVPGLTAEVAAEFATREEADRWARLWIRRAGLRLAQAV